MTQFTQDVQAYNEFLLSLKPVEVEYLQTCRRDKQ